MQLSEDERLLLLAALFDLHITYAEETEKGARIKTLVVKLGGDPDAALFGAYGISCPVPTPRLYLTIRPTRPTRADGPAPDRAICVAA
jgi:hypothetical protein